MVLVLRGRLLKVTRGKVRVRGLGLVLVLRGSLLKVTRGKVRVRVWF